jgi:hypothetical protein
MATLATVCGRLFTTGAERSAAASRNAMAPRNAAPGRKPSIPVRVFPNEDIYFFVKRIDNRRLVRQADPQARGDCWRMIGSAGVAAMLLIGVLLPSAYGLLAGYQIQSLKEEGKRLATEQASLELQEAKLLSPARMEELARMQRFTDPEAQKVVYLDSKNGPALAMNGGK